MRIRHWLIGVAVEREAITDIVLVAAEADHGTCLEPVGSLADFYAMINESVD